VEAALEHHELSAGPVAARHLERALDRLGPGVAEEHLAAERGRRKTLSQPHPGLGVEEVAHVHEAPRLLAHRANDRRVAVPELGHRDARQEVEVFVALGVPQPGALAPNELDRVAHVRAHHRRALECPKRL
jgi:hypothetical protein